MRNIRAACRSVILVAVVAIVCAGQQVRAAMVLYGATAASLTGELYVLDATTGAIVLDVGPLNDGNGLNYGITGLAQHPVTGVLYGSTHNLTTADPATLARLVTIDLLTARVTVIGPFEAGNTGARAATMADLAFDAAGNLYGVGSVGGPQLYSISLANGKATVIGSTGLTSTSGGGVSVSSSGTVYGTPTTTRFGTYSLATGAFTNIANPVKPVGGGYAALSFDESGTLYGLDLGPSPALETHLVTFDLATGAITDIGASVVGLDAIAFVQIPEPVSAASLLVAALALGGMRPRRKPVDSHIHTTRQR